MKICQVLIYHKFQEKQLIFKYISTILKYYFKYYFYIIILPLQNLITKSYQKQSIFLFIQLYILYLSFINFTITIFQEIIISSLILTIIFILLSYIFTIFKITDLRIAGKYQLEKRVAAGAFGTIYQGRIIATGELVAVKLEDQNQKPACLIYESKMYQRLLGGVGIPYVYYFGQEANYNVLVMDLLGPSLEELLEACDHQFSLKTTLMLAEQLITRLEYLHLKQFIHRDQKPDNYCIGRLRRKSTVYLIDYGLSKRYITNGQHIPYKEHRSLTGTARYCSVNNHLGIEPSRRDDLESLCYILIYFLRGSLPWSGLKGVTKKQKYDKILEKKMATPAEVLCRNLPSEFCQLLSYTKSLRFEDKPDYAFMRKLCRELFVRMGYSYDYAFDWVVKGLDTDNWYLGKKVENKDSDQDGFDQQKHEEMIQQQQNQQQNVKPEIKEQETQKSEKRSTADLFKDRKRIGNDFIY